MRLMPFSAGTPNEERNDRVVATSRRGSEGPDIVDVSASDARLRELEGLDALARRHGRLERRPLLEPDQPAEPAISRRCVVNRRKVAERLVWRVGARRRTQRGQHDLTIA